MISDLPPNTCLRRRTPSFPGVFRPASMIGIGSIECPLVGHREARSTFPATIPGPF